MNQETRRKFLLGVLVASGCILFIIGIFLIGSKQNMFSKTFNISAIFNDLSGLRKGDYVRFAGVKAGIVSKITFLNDSMIKVDMKLDKDFQELIKKDAVVIISTDGLVGNKIVNIRPKWKIRESVKENGVLAAVNPFDTEKIIEKLIGTNENVSVISNNLAKLSSRINQKKSIFETLMNDTAASGDVKEIIKEVKISGNQLVDISSGLEKIIDKIEAGQGLAGVLFKDSLIAKQIEQTLANVKATSDYSAIITGELTKSMQAGNNNTISLLMKDTSFAQNLKQSVINLQRSTQKLNDNMEGLQHSFLLRKYFKKRTLKPLPNS